LDKKDPLNRFGGLFDGSTHGNGMFVLIDEINCRAYEIAKKHNRTPNFINISYFL